MSDTDAEWYARQLTTSPGFAQGVIDGMTAGLRAGRRPEPEPLDVREARRVVNEYECALHGHRWLVIEADARPVQILCDRCDRILDIAVRGPSLDLPHKQGGVS